jgi:hypothetical protein
MLSQHWVSTAEAVSDSELSVWPRATTAAPDTWAAAPPAWQTAAVAAYALEAGAGGTHLRAELSMRVHELTGCAISDGAITVNCEARRASAALDREVFQLRGHDLILLRPCAYCGTGCFESPSLCSRADLGHALAGWHAYHAGCEPADPAEGEGDW